MTQQSTTWYLISWYFREKKKILLQEPDMETVLLEQWSEILEQHGLQSIGQICLKRDCFYAIAGIPKGQPATTDILEQSLRDYAAECTKVFQRLSGEKKDFFSPAPRFRLLKDDDALQSARDFILQCILNAELSELETGEEDEEDDD